MRAGVDSHLIIRVSSLLTFMGNETLILDLREIRTKAGLYILILSREDLSGVFPGLFRYNVSLIINGITVLVFRTNTFEYSPGSRHGAEAVSRNKMDEWDRIVQKDPGSLISPPVKRQSVNRPSSVADVVILQGSPRADGNCGLIAGWAADAARSAGKKYRCFFPMIWTCISVSGVTSASIPEPAHLMTI